MEKYDVLESDCFYHIFNRGNNKEDIFKESDNYYHFLKLLKKHILPIADIYAYCLMKNHFHLLIKIKSFQNLQVDDKLMKLKNLSQPFSNLFNAYTKSINKRYNREGSLFKVRFKRNRMTNEEYLKNAILYIHLNPLKHGFTDNFENYEYSSYRSILSNKRTELKRREVIDFFGNKENFILVHKNSFNKIEELDF